MLFQYHPETDMLYIKLSDATSVDSEEVSAGVVLDFDARERVVGIELEDASRLIDLTRIEVLALPVARLVLSEHAEAS